MSDDKTFIEWSHKVLEELVALNARVESLDEKHEMLRTGMTERFAHIENKIEKVSNLLNGNGSPEKGLIVRVDRLEQKDVADLDVRVDRLEQSEKKRSWLLKATIMACIGAVATAIMTWFKVPM